MGGSTKSSAVPLLKNIGFNFLQDSYIKSSHPLLPAEEHVDQQLQQISLAYHGPEEEFRDEAGCDALQCGGGEKDPSEALPVPRVEEPDHLAKGVLSFLLQAFNEQSCL